MFAFRQYDTNNRVRQARLNTGASPPQKKCAMSPSKVPFNSDLLFHAGDDESTSSDLSGFQFDLKSVAFHGQHRQEDSERANLLGQVSSFDEHHFASQKTSMLDKFDDNQTLDNYICALECRDGARGDDRSIKPMKKISDPSFSSPEGKSTGTQSMAKSQKTKKHSPLKKMGSLLKESKIMAEGRGNNQTASSKSPKRTITKMFAKSSSADN